MKDKIQKLIAEIIGDGFTVEVKPVAVKPVSSGNVSSDFGAGVTTYLSVYTDSEGFQAIYVNGELEFYEYAVDGPDVVRVADGRLVRMRSAVLSGSLDMWPGDESDLKDMIDGYQAGIDAGAAIGAPDRDGLVLLSEWNNERGCFEDSIVEPPADHIADANKMVPPTGYRLLKSAKVEPRKTGDLFWSLSAKKWLELVPGCVEYANRDDWHACRKIETANPPVVPDSSVPDPGPGYRLLSKDPPERLLDTDEGFFTNGRDGFLWQSVNYSGGDQLPLVYYRRKIEEPAEARENEYRTPHPGDVGKRIEVRDSEDSALESSVWVERTLVAVLSCPGERPQGEFVTAIDGYDAKHICHTYRFARIKIEQPANEPETQYREPTYADLANGPIEVEVCDDNTCETNWEKRMLYAVLPVKSMFPFVVGLPEDDEFTQNWKHARIKVC